MKTYILNISLIFFLICNLQAQDERKIFGKVTDGKSPIADVNVSIENSGISTTTDAEGNYELKVSTGDLISYSYTGLKTIKIKVEEVTRVLSPVMIPDVTELKEVIVKGSNRKSQSDLRNEYVINDRIVKTAYGYLNADTAPGIIRTIGEKDINMVNISILGVLQNRFPGVTVQGVISGQGATNGLETDTPERSSGVFIRGRNSLQNQRSAVFDVDGQIFTDVPTFIDLGNIKRIAILNNVALTSRYGNLGHGGVIVINTFTGTSGEGKSIDQGRLRNNFYDGKALSRLQLQKNEPSYLKELKAAPSFDNAKKIYEKYEAAYYSSPYFFLDAYTYFTEKWNNLDFADSILNENYGLFENNPVLLKALAYNFDQQERFERSNEVYKDAFILRPNYAQSYLDIANSYRDLKEPAKAATIYARYEYLITEGFLEKDSIGFGPLIDREYNNLLALDKKALITGKNSDKLFIAEEEFKGTRIVFEWNDSEAEFDLQFVNPENQYLKWKHSLADNDKIISIEKEYGFNTKEYLIDGSLPGTWQVNVSYLGNKSLTPTYLKATVYNNYGTMAQTKEIKVFKLYLKNVNTELFKINIAGSIVQQ